MVRRKLGLLVISVVLAGLLASSSVALAAAKTAPAPALSLQAKLLVDGGQEAVYSGVSGKVFVSDRTGVTVIDPKKRVVVKHVELGGWATTLLASDSAKKVFALVGGTIWVIDPVTYSVTGSLPLPTSGAYDFAYSPRTNRLYCVNNTATYGWVDVANGVTATETAPVAGSYASMLLMSCEYNESTGQLILTGPNWVIPSPPGVVIALDEASGAVSCYASDPIYWYRSDFDKTTGNLLVAWSPAQGPAQIVNWLCSQGAFTRVSDLVGSAPYEMRLGDVAVNDVTKATWGVQVDRATGTIGRVSYYSSYATTLYGPSATFDTEPVRRVEVAENTGQAYVVGQSGAVYVLGVK